MEPFMVYGLLLCFAASCAISLTLTNRVRDGAIALGLVTSPGLDRHIHTRAMPRLGGVAVYLAVILTVLLNAAASKWMGVQHQFSTHYMAGLLGPATIIFLLGVYDDLRGAKAFLKFCVQTTAAGLLYWAGNGVEQFDLYSWPHALGTALGLLMTVFWVLLVTNAFNLIDGLDGLAAGSAFFSAISILVISQMRGNFTASFITIALAGAMLGFLRYNFNPATIFLGDSGSLFVGFLLSALALSGLQRVTTIVSVAIPMIAFGLPLLDVTLALARRFLSGKPLFDGDSDHIHHKLLKRGFSHRSAVLTLCAVTVAFGLLSLLLLHGKEMLPIVLVVISISVPWAIRQLRYEEFSKFHELLQSVSKRRRIIRNRVSARHPADSLITCPDPSISELTPRTMPQDQVIEKTRRAAAND